MNDNTFPAVCQEESSEHPSSLALKPTPLYNRELPADDSQDSRPGHGGEGCFHALGSRESRGRGAPALITAWGNFLDENWTWDWFFTLTFAKPIGEWGADRRFHTWMKFLRRRIGHRIEFARVVEYQDRGVPHYHGFALNTDGYRRLTAKDMWERLGYGYARVLPYDRSRHARYYLGKYVVKDLEWGSIVFSRNLRRFYKGSQVKEIERVFGDMEVLHPGGSSRTKAHKSGVAEVSSPAQ